MDSDRHRRVTEIFSEASALSPDERAVYLDEACAGDAELREEVDSLLAFDEGAEELLSATAVGHHFRSLLNGTAAAGSEIPYPERIGPYSVLGVLGAGGQGIVFKAEQQTPRRIVALKMLRAGVFATEDDLRRFRTEIQALALLRHPNIATIYDGGHTEDGHHFFTMEFVEGAPVTAYATENSLSIQDRLELFCRVCDGVDHAHQKGVVHRDLKPTNILIDTEGNPKLLDFGLVRVTGADISTVSARSATGFIVGSFGYMSPEQARGEKEGVGAQTDVYSLGVILYELLTDARPYDVDSSLTEAVRTICETPPNPPSKRNRELRGDLDTVVIKALEKDRARRYGSVAQLADDLRRFLRGEPIRARAPSLAYVLAKKARKHRRGLGVAAAALALVFVWIGLWSWSSAKEVAQAREQAVKLQWTLERAPPERALGPARALFENHRELPEAGLVAAQAQYRSGLERGENRYIRAGMASERDAWAFRLLLGRIYRETDPGLARQTEEQALLGFPDTAEGWHLRSFTTFDLREAIRCSNAALELDPRHANAWTRLAFLCERVADFDCAYDAADRLLYLQRSTRHRGFWTRFQAVVLLKQGKFRESIRRYDSLLAIQPAKHRYHLADRALAYLSLEEYEQAIADYSSVIDANGTLAAWSRLWRATPLWILGRLEDALEDYETYRRMHGVVSYADVRLFFLRHERARLLDEQGRSDIAASLRVRAATELQAARGEAEEGSWLRNILDCAAGEMTPDELLRAADQSDRERMCEAHYYAAEVSLLAGRVEDARRWFRDCLTDGSPFDADEFADPLSEYHLARWRIDQLVGGV